MQGTGGGYGGSWRTQLGMTAMPFYLRPRKFKFNSPRGHVADTIDVVLVKDQVSPFPVRAAFSVRCFAGRKLTAGEKRSRRVSRSLPASGPAPFSPGHCGKGRGRGPRRGGRGPVGEAEAEVAERPLLRAPARLRSVMSLPEAAPYGLRSRSLPPPGAGHEQTEGSAGEPQRGHHRLPHG